MQDNNHVSDKTSPPPENDVPIAPPLEKKADRPHRYTLYASFGSLALSILSLSVSGLSIYYTRQSMHVAQRAYLSFAVTFPVFSDQPNTSEDDLLSLPAGVEIKNLGNTPAYNINATVFPNKSDSPYKIYTIHEAILPAIGPKESARIGVNVEGSRRTYKNGLTFPASAPAMCIRTAYTDVFGDVQTDQACFQPGFEIKMELYNPPRRVAPKKP